MRAVNGLFVALAVVAVSAGAPAHLRFPKVKAERLVDLRLDEDPIRIGYRIGFGGKLADAARRAADRDGDFQVSAAEGNAALDARSEALLAGLEICTGRSLTALECRHLAMRDIESVEADGWTAPSGSHLQLSWTLRLHERARDLGAIRVADAFDVSGVEISDVQIRSPHHTPLTLAGEGDRKSGVVDRFTWIEAKRELGPRVIVAAWAPPPPTRRGWLLGAAAGIFLVAMGGWYFARARRQKTP